jgi:beta-glucanase (GH16 family)
MKPFITFALLISTMSTVRGDEWQFVWGDEFDKPGLPDPTKWSYETGFIANHEKQFYTRDRQENARIENGMLIIEAHKEKYASPAPKSKDKDRVKSTPQRADYTSARITSRGKGEWTYGRIEARAKLPSGRGTWPAIWTLGANSDLVGWPTCGEIDIMEFVGFDPGVVHANVHTRKYNHSVSTGKGDKILIADASESFHIYAIEWNAEKIDFYADNRKYFTFNNEHSGVEAWPYDKNQFIILNLAIGGDWGGQKGIDDSIFPQRFIVDYVRVYQKSKPTR